MVLSGEDLTFPSVMPNMWGFVLIQSGVWVQSLFFLCFPELSIFFLWPMLTSNFSKDFFILYSLLDLDLSFVVLPREISLHFFQLYSRLVFMYYYHSGVVLIIILSYWKINVKQNMQALMSVLCLKWLIISCVNIHTYMIQYTTRYSKLLLSPAYLSKKLVLICQNSI